MAGSSHHYLPAGFLGRFSSEAGSTLRERKLSVIQEGKVQSIRAEDIGCAPNLYLLQGSQKLEPDTVDDVWSLYETNLDSAINELCNPKQKTIPANTWLRVLVPFVTGLFVRGPEFTERYESRPGLKEIYEKGNFADDAWKSDNTN